MPESTLRPSVLRAGLRRAPEATRFAIFGGVALAIDLAALASATRLLGLNPYLGRVVSFLIAATVAWFLHRRFTFRSNGRRRHWLLQWFIFLCANTLGFSVNVTIYVIFLEMVSWTTPEISLLIASATAMVINYVLNASITFR